MRKVVFTFLVISLFASAHLLIGQSHQTTKEEQAVLVADQQWEKASEAKDVDKAVSFYADDGVMLEPGTPIVKGKDAIRQAWQRFFADPAFALTWRADAVQVAQSGDLAYTRGTFDLRYSGPDGKPASMHGKYMTVWKKIGGKWKAIADMNNDDGQPGKPAEGK